MSEVKNEVRAILRDVSQVVVGEVVREDDKVLVLSKPVIVNFSPAQDGSVNIQFVPMELLSLNPPLSLRMFFTDENKEKFFELTFVKDQLLDIDLPLTDQVYDGYRGAMEPRSPIETPDAGGIVGPDGAPLGSVEPKVQDLF